MFSRGQVMGITSTSYKYLRKSPCETNNPPLRKTFDQNPNFSELLTNFVKKKNFYNLPKWICTWNFFLKGLQALLVRVDADWIWGFEGGLRCRDQRSVCLSRTLLDVFSNQRVVLLVASAFHQRFVEKFYIKKSLEMTLLYSVSTLIAADIGYALDIFACCR